MQSIADVCRFDIKKISILMDIECPAFELIFGVKVFFDGIDRLACFTKK